MPEQLSPGRADKLSKELRELIVSKMDLSTEGHPNSTAHDKRVQSACGLVAALFEEPKSGDEAISVMCRFCKPLDMRLLRQMAKEHPIMITVEENGIGGFGSHGEPRSCIISRAPVILDTKTLSLVLHSLI